jgi:hypothetical protein
MGWVVSVTPRPCFIPGERTPGTNWTGGWVGRRASLNTVLPLLEIEPLSPGRPACNEATYWLSYPPVLLTLWRRSLSKCYLRIQSVPQREHHTYRYKDQLGNAFKENNRCLHAKPINTKCSITDCQSRWFIYLPLGLNALIILYKQIFSV